MLKTLAMALQFLTRFYVYRGEFDERAYGRAPVFFPLVGLFLGAAWMALYFGLSSIFPPAVTAALLVLGMVVFSGGLHLDGFMDTMDGIFSGRSREKMLEIMRDSRVGAFGVLGLACLLLLKFALLFSLPREVLPRLLLIVPAISRWGMVYAIARFPYARPQGLGLLQVRHTRGRELALASLFALGAAVLGGPVGLVLLFLSLVLVHQFGRYLTGRLGGLTGDTYGAINEILEVFLLLVAYPLLNYLPVTLW
ncbi:adenosylcobinamide-GDP ribazoletransferase [Desulfofundulus salinus]|uniref:Adenosylcobinamide-GDP ribazoletransferase n=1 Tax=Desulfofundulus salinus TaxID=2419843 RepID=A0A494X0K5_9FIRM|nr:adenosylcobinamide-GDP ribazoletransferase [Desulfofundulus salinum]RKO66470.1 adenosylcobinamide-GDP ribazoletransferase [Desulfofundulus salinum]